jgi:hypothetical protein
MPEIFRNPFFCRKTGFRKIKPGFQPDFGKINNLYLSGY